MEIYRNLKKARVACGMTQAQAAEQLHATRQAISSYETGRTQPDIPTLERLADIYGLSLEQLLYGEDREQRKRRRLYRAAWIVLACFLLALFIYSAMMWGTNHWLTPPGLGSGPVPVTDDIRPILELRMSLVDARTAFHAAVTVLFRIALLVLLFFDVSLRGARRLRTRVLLFAVLVAGSLLVTIPWGLFDPLYGTAEYRISTYSGIFFAACILLVDSGVIVYRRLRAKQK